MDYDIFINSHVFVNYYFTLRGKGRHRTQSYDKKPLHPQKVSFNEIQQTKIVFFQIIVRILFKVTADRKGDNSPTRGRSRTGRLQIITLFDTKFNISIKIKMITFNKQRVEINFSNSKTLNTDVFIYVDFSIFK